MKSYRHSTGEPEKTQAVASNDQQTQTSNSTANGDSEREVYLRQAQAVVDESNKLAAEGKDKVWAEQNGGNVGVFPDNGVKPDEWKRGISTKDGGFGYVHGAEATGIDDLQEFREQIMHDLNFNKVFDEYQNEAEFESAVVAQYGQGGAERADQVRAIAQNLWSYATTGADVEGSTDVAELQGLLYSLDPLIAEASQSNTKHENTFTIPGTDMELHSGGDDYYGRATMLEARLLSSVLKEKAAPSSSTSETPFLDQVVEETSVNNTLVDDDVFAKSTFVTDVSHSMNSDRDDLADFFAEVDFGDTSIAGMTGFYNDLSWHKDGAAVPMAEGREVMRDLADANGSGETLDRRAARISGAFEKYGKGEEESPITTALNLLREVEVDDAGIAKIRDQQIVIATDENDSHPAQLRELWNLARSTGVRVKVLYLKGADTLEISINDIEESFLDVFEADYAAGMERKKAVDESTWNAEGKKTQYNNEEHYTAIEKNDNDRTTTDSGSKYHLSLDWEKLAEYHQIEGWKGVENRESRRTTE